MKRLLTLLVTLLACGMASVASAGLVYINVSVKLIAHPADGDRPRLNPANANTRVTDASINQAVADANSFLAAYQRGIRIRIMETKTIGGLGLQHSNSTRTQPGYYAVQTSDTAPLTFLYPTGYTNPAGQAVTSGPLIDVLDQNARSTAATKLAFQWNDQAVNIFVPSGWGGGGGIFPNSGNAAGFGYFEGWLFLHELGHYFNLQHTFDSTDYVADTLVDPNSADQDTIAQELFGAGYGGITADQQTSVNTEFYLRARNSIAAANNTAPNDVLSSSTYSLLPATEQQLVDDVFFNIMSYYDAYRRNQFVTRMTEGQADRMTDAMNDVRRPGVSGYTRFVALTGANTLFGLTNTGLNSVLPVRTVTAALQRAAGGGDDEIILLRPGHYNETGRFNTPCTLRATRKGSGVIGAP